MLEPFTGLASFGWRESCALEFPKGEGLVGARVVAEHRINYRVQMAIAERSAKVSGKLRHLAVCQADLPAVGDWVAVDAPAGDGEVVIHHVLPRKSKFSRKVAGVRTQEQVVAANVDYVWIVTALDRDFNLRRIERYLTLAWESGAAPVIVLNKADIATDLESSRWAVHSIAPGTPVHAVSSLTGEGVRELDVYLEDHATIALLGSSGVGKSTLINALAGASLQPTGHTRDDGKGRHTTTGRQLIRLPCGGLVVDTPGMRELQLWDGQAGLADSFSDIDELSAACRFSDCQHAGEPGCAVTDAMEQGRIPAERLTSYQKLKRELAHLDRKQDARSRQEEKHRWRAVTKSLRHHPKYKRRDGWS
jgi:ribosome biogenesis GTPase